jgi:hypothetical protein
MVALLPQFRRAPGVGHLHENQVDHIRENEVGHIHEKSALKVGHFPES